MSASGTSIGACLAGARIKATGVKDLIAQGKLVELLKEWQGESFSPYALHPSRHLPLAKVRAFIDFVLQVLQQDVRAGVGIEGQSRGPPFLESFNAR